MKLIIYAQMLLQSWGYILVCEKFSTHQQGVKFTSHFSVKIQIINYTNMV